MELPVGDSKVLAEAKEIEAHSPDSVYAYSPDHLLYLSRLRTRLVDAKNARDQKRTEYDDMTYVDRYDEEEKLAFTYTEAKQNEEDTTFMSGTVEQKLNALLAAINMLNLEPEFSAFDPQEQVIDELGNALEIVYQRAEELDETLPEEQRLMRQGVLLRHGHVFTQRYWGERWRPEKTLNIKKFTGKVDGIKWTTRLQKVWEGMKTHVVDGRKVFLGDMKQFFLERQPYIFTVEDVPWEEAEQMFGQWDMWKYVPKDRKRFAEEVTNRQELMHDHTWTLTPLRKGRAEIVRYEAVPDNELQIIVNGQPLMPIGFPLPWKYEGYSLVQQNFGMIKPEFAYGKSFVWRLRTSTKLLDEASRILILDLQRIGNPPRGNTSGRIVGKNIFMPGKITIDVAPEHFKPLVEPTTTGTIAGELEVMKYLSENIDSNSVNPTFTGQKAEGDPTATEVIELQRQAKMVLGLTVFACAMLEKKLGQMGLNILIENWFQPIGTRLDEARNVIVNKYRVASVERTVGEKGKGIYQMMPTEDMQRFPPDAEQRMETSHAVYDEEEESSTPVRKFYLNVKDFHAARITWKVIVNPTEQRSSERSKLLFERMLITAMKLFPNVNFEYAEQRFAETWQENPSKLFSAPGAMNPSLMQAGLPAGVAAGGIGMGQPNVNMPQGTRAMMGSTPQF